MEEKLSERELCLKAARDCVCKDRENDYGSPEDNFITIADYWSSYLSKKHHKAITVSASDVAIMMTLMKIARLTSGNFKGDSYIDACGYLACGYEIEINEVKKR